MSHLRFNNKEVGAGVKSVPNSLNFERLFKSYYPRLCYYANQILGDNDAVDDMVQDAFVKFWNKLSDFENEVASKTFLYITVRNACLNLLRHQKVEQRFTRQLDSEPVEEGYNLTEIIKAEVLGEIYHAIEQLPAGAKQVFQLAYIDGLKNQEIADQLGVNINTIKTQKARALQLLRLKFSPDALLLFSLLFLK
jgi:RNA polymerase sigma-70 factor (family 1)